jgi:tryptophanyl-tRNA synthetase
MIEQSNEIVRRLNRQIGWDLLPEARALIPEVGRLPGVDGKTKMSKSQGNAISLSATDSEITAAVRKMYTDPAHLQVNDPGRVEDNVVFAYLDAFDDDREAVAEMKVHYRKGGLGDVVLKRRLETILHNTIGPIRDRRAILARDPDYVMDILRTGNGKAREITAATQAEVHRGLGLFTRL